MLRSFTKKLAGFLLVLLAFNTSHAQEACDSPGGGCDTIGIEHKISPWRIGGYLGPGIAYCGSWANTFPLSEARDQTLFNGIGINGAINADYFFTKRPEAQFKFGVGATFGVQHFFVRPGYDEWIDSAIRSAQLTRNDVEIKKSTSEDFYLVVGPVATWAFTKSRRSPFLEASLKGGVFRTTPAAISVREIGNPGAREQVGIYAVSPNGNRYHFGGLAAVGVFFPLKNPTWSLGFQAQGYRTKVSYDMPWTELGSPLYISRYNRSHGGFNAGIALRKSFEYDIPVKKDPSAGLTCITPTLSLTSGNSSVIGKYFTGKEENCEPIVASWTSSLDPVLADSLNQTFTARIHHLAAGEDKIIAEAICQKDTELAFPSSYVNNNGCPVDGQYYVTVQSHQASACAACISPVAASGFAALKADTVKVVEEVCVCVKKIEISSIRRVTSTIRKWAKSENCEDCICPVDSKVTRNRKIILHSSEVKDCDEFKTIEEVLANVKAPKWAKNVTIDIETTSYGNACPETGVKKTSYSATVNADGTIIYQGVK
jgi:hypothetical protein